MKKYILIILTILALTSCDSKLRIDNNKNKNISPYIVRSISEHSKTYSFYTIDNNTSYAFYINEFELVLPKGFYNTGDTVKIKVYK